MSPLEGRRLEQSAVEVRDAPESPRTGIALAKGRVQATEEERGEDVREEVALLQSIEEEPPLAVQPPLFLHERQKQQPRQDQQRLGVTRSARFVRVSRGQ